MPRTIMTAFIALLVSPVWAADTSSKVAVLGLVLAPPGVWSKVPKDDPDLAVYRARDVPEQITLRIMRSSKRMDPKLRRETVDALVEHRQTAERRGADGEVSFEPVKNSERNGLTIASYCGADRTSGRPFATMVLASQDSAWALFYETGETPAATFCSRAEKLFATVLEATKKDRK
jgi:hypothetical protein